ncbi:MAG: hypothetical protein HQM09_17140 [Candidatus Riflebacteria bacterium]|nr:hypothetical protein [Candidatus Riflebacteria bacterium]
MSSDVKRVKWYEYHPKFRALLQARLDTGKVAFFRPLSGIDGLELLDKGCVSGISLHNGKCYAVPSIGAMIADRNFQDLLLLLTSFSPYQRRQYKYLFSFLECSKEDQANAHQELEKVIARREDLNPILLLITAYEEKDRGLELLKDFPRSDNLKVSCEISRALKILFDDDVSSRGILEEVEAALSPQTPLAANEGDDNENCGVWINCSEAWKDLFHEDERARNCLEKAEEMAVSSANFGSCAYNWMKIFGEEQCSKQCLETAKNKLVRTSEWLDFAGIERILCGKEENTRKFLENAESTGGRFYDWGFTAGSWKDMLNDEERSLKCLTEMEAMAETPNDWIMVAKLRYRAEDNPEEIRRCLTRSSSQLDLPVSKRFNFWINNARAWDRLLSDDGMVKASLYNAENAAEHSIDLTTCAELWLEILDSKKDALRCLRKAEEVATTSTCWKNIAKVWSSLLNDDCEAGRCSEQAVLIDNGRNTKSFKDEVKQWKTMFPDCPKDILEIKEKAAKNSSDLVLCAECWSEIFDSEADARRCLVRGEDIAKEASDWAMVAEGWINILEDDSSARRCLTQRQIAKHPD